LCSSEEAEQLMTEVVEKFVADRNAGRKPHTSIFFLGRENFPKSFKNEMNKISYEASVPQVLLNNLGSGKNVMLMTTGSLVGEALKASEELKSKNIGSVVVHQNCLNKIQLSPLKDLLAKCEGRLVTSEDHQVLLGFGSFVTHQLSSVGYSTKIKTLGVHGQFGQSAYNAIELYRKHGIDSSAMVKAAVEL
jgi:transketolase